MNLKEAFRYQNYLESLMKNAQNSIVQRDHCLKVTETHLRSKANPDAIDVVKEAETTEDFFPNDDVIRLLVWLITEREKLSVAINKAKQTIGFDIDAAVESNKFRQRACVGIKGMLIYKASKCVRTGQDYKFNNEGVQTPYVYEVEAVYEEAFDRQKSKEIMRSMLSEADEVSAKIDQAMVNTLVDYDVVYDVNESFEDVMEKFAAAV